MGVQETYFDGLDAAPDWNANPQTPEAFERFHRWLYRGCLFFFAALVIDGFIIFPLILLRYGWQ
jgi:hypothetical protein